MVTTLLLAPALHYRKSHWAKCSNGITPALPRHCGDNQKVLVLHHSPAIHVSVGSVDTNDCCINRNLRGTATVKKDNQWSKQEACFACAYQVLFAVIHNTSVTSGEWVQCLKRIARESKLGSCQSNLCHSWGYERLQKILRFIKGLLWKCKYYIGVGYGNVITMLTNWMDVGMNPVGT